MGSEEGEGMGSATGGGGGAAEVVGSVAGEGVGSAREGEVSGSGGRGTEKSEEPGRLRVTVKSHTHIEKAREHIPGRVALLVLPETGWT